MAMRTVSLGLVACLTVSTQSCAQAGRGHLSKRQQDQLSQCQVATHTPDELVHCLAIDKNWPAEQAALEGKHRQQLLDSLAASQAAQAQAAWVADSAEHRYQLSQCDYHDSRFLPSLCLVKNFSWPPERAQAADDSVWRLSEAKHAKDIVACRSASSPAFCLSMDHGWPDQKALAADDSLSRAAFKSQKPH